MKLKTQFFAGVVRVFGIFLAGVLILSLGMVTPVQATGVPDLTITKSHTGDFTQAGVGTYTITVTNSGTAPTDNSTITVDDYALPASLTATDISGTGWACTLATLICTRAANNLAAGSSFPIITLAVNVAVDAPASVTNEVDVNGGGEVVTTNNAASDPTTIIQLPDLTIAKSHIGNFAQGGTGTYTITVTNSGVGPTTGSPITVTDTLPVGLTASGLSGTNWTCTPVPLTCTRSDIQVAGFVFPDITLTVNVAPDAAASVTNEVDVNGGGEVDTTNNVASDPTTITQKPDLIITGVILEPRLNNPLPPYDPIHPELQCPDPNSQLPPASPYSPAPDEFFCARITVKNQGGAGSASNVQMHAYIDRVPVPDEFGCISDAGDYSREANTNPLLSGAEVTYDLNFSQLLGAGVHQIYAYTDANCIVDESVENNNSYGPITVGGATVNVDIGGVNRGSYPLALGNSTVASYDMSNGPVETKNFGGVVPIIAAERVIYAVNGINTSYSELMGLPKTQAATSYLFPWYNNLQLNSQLRFGNVGTNPTVVSIKIHGVLQPTTYSLAPGASTVATFAVSDGPVEVLSDGENIIAAERVVYAVNGTNTSYSELMGLPKTQAATSYLFPWYNNLQLNSQLRFGNVGTNPTVVSIKIHGVLQPTTYSLAAGASTVATFAVSDGPVEVLSDGEKIIAAERVVYAVNGISTSYSELMGVPKTQTATSYLFPWYNNLQLNSQLRFGNVGTNPTVVSIKIHGVLQPTTYSLAAGASTVATFAVSDGPVEVLSDGEKIIVAERVVYAVNGINTSYSEMMGLPKTQAATSYLFPWYNNLQLISQLRFGIP